MVRETWVLIQRFGTWGGGGGRAAYNYAVKVDLRKGDWNPQRKFGVTANFSEIFELKFGEKSPYWNNCYPPILFLDSDPPCLLRSAFTA